MYKGQKSVRGGIEDFLCPFTDMYITQGSNGAFSHRGTMANDVRGLEAGVRYPYYAPCDCTCIAIYPDTGQAMWQSLNKVRFANGRIDYATFMTVHDDTFDAYIGLVRKQGEQIGNMGMKGFATGVHCHIEIAQSKFNANDWVQNIYDIWCFREEYDTDDCYFVDCTNIINGMGGNWRSIEAVPVDEQPTIEPTPIESPIPKADQVLYVGSKVTPGGTQIEDIKTINGETTFYSSKYGVWLPIIYWYRVGEDGKWYPNQISSKGNWIMCDVVFDVVGINVPNQTADVKMGDNIYTILSSSLYEVSDK